MNWIAQSLVLSARVILAFLPTGELIISSVLARNPIAPIRPRKGSYGHRPALCAIFRWNLNPTTERHGHERVAARSKGRYWWLLASLLVTRTLLGAPGRTTRSILTTSYKKLLGAPGIATRSNVRY